MFNSDIGLTKYTEFDIKYFSVAKEVTIGLVIHMYFFETMYVPGSFTDAQTTGQTDALTAWF